MKKIIVVSCIILFLIIPSQIHAEGKVQINEFLSHPSSGNKEWVEIANPDHIDLSTFWIDDDESFTEDTGSGAKKPLVNMNTDNPDYPYLEFSSFFNNDGDKVVLFDANGNIVDQYEYNQDPGIDKSIGRYPDGVGEFHILIAATKGSPNASLLPTDTPNPTPTDKPTSTPKPTKMPTPTNIPTPTKILTLRTPTIKESGGTTFQVNTKNLYENKKIAAISASPSAILGISTISATITFTPTPKIAKPKVLIKGIQTKNNVLKAVIALGIAIICMSCGILIFIKKRQKTIRE